MSETPYTVKGHLAQQSDWEGSIWTVDLIARSPNAPTPTQPLVGMVISIDNNLDVQVTYSDESTSASVAATYKANNGQLVVPATFDGDNVNIVLTMITLAPESDPDNKNEWVFKVTGFVLYDDPEDTAVMGGSAGGGGNEATAC